MSKITREQMLQVFENRCSTRYYDPDKKISQRKFCSDFRICPPLAQFCRFRAMEIFGYPKQSLERKAQTF